MKFILINFMIKNIHLFTPFLFPRVPNLGLRKRRKRCKKYYYYHYNNIS